MNQRPMDPGRCRAREVIEVAGNNVTGMKTTANLPLGWKIEAVGRACSIRNDLRLPISRSQRIGRAGEYPYYGPTGVLDYINDFRLTGTYALIGEDGDHFLEYDRKPQTLLVSGRFNVNNHAHVIESTEICEAEWFYNYFQHRNIRRYLTRQGAGRYKLNKETLERLEILLPPKDEQLRINKLIRSWSRAIERTDALLLAKSRLRRAHELHLLGARKQTQPNLQRADSLFDVVSEKGRADLELLSVTQDRGVIPRRMLEKQILMASSNPNSFKVVREGDFVISLRSFQGGLEYSPYEGVVSPAYTVLRPRSHVVPSYFRHYLKSGDFLKRLSVAVIGIRDGKQISFTDFASIKLPLPPRGDQESTALFFDSLEREIDILKELRAALQKQKLGLMQKLLVGQWRVAPAKNSGV